LRVTGGDKVRRASRGRQQLQSLVPIDNKRHRALTEAIKSIERAFGNGAIKRVSDVSPAQPLTTGSVALDIALGAHGLPRGRIVEIFGADDSAKTTLALSIIANEQRGGGMCAYIDADYALAPDYAAVLGVQDQLLVFEPYTGESAFEIVERLVRSKAVSLIVIDSIAALSPKAELEAEIGDRTHHLQSQLIAQAMRKLTGVLSRNGCTLILLNQLRIGRQPYQSNPEYLPGGNALRAHATVRIWLSKEGLVNADGRDSIIRAHVVKNKTGPNLRFVELALISGKGFCRANDAVRLGLLAKIMQQGDNAVCYRRDFLGSTRDDAISTMRRRPALVAAIERRLHKKREHLLSMLPQAGYRPHALEPEVDPNDGDEEY
jgi:recombination protein RecA